MKFPACVTEYIRLIVKKMRYRRKVRRDVQAELTAHFEDGLKDCKTDKDKEQKARWLIAEFGDVKMLAVLLRRAKKRCRPLWRTALVRSFQALGIVVLYFLICLSPLLVGKPTISVNYVDWLNELVRAGRDERDNARPYYERAVELYVEMPEKWLYDSSMIWSADLNDVQLSLVSDWLQDNEGAIEALRQGSRCPAYWNKYKSDETELIMGLVADAMEILPEYKPLALAVRWQIRYERFNGDIETAFSDCVALIKFGGHMHGKGLLIEQLVGIAIEGLTNNAILMLLDRGDVPADVLKITQEELDKQFDKQETIISMEAEKVFWYDAIQRGFTDDGQGSGRMLVHGLPYVATDDWIENLWRFVSFSYPDRQKMVANIDRYFERFAEILAETPWNLRDVPIDELEQSEDIQITPFMLKINTPPYKRINQIAWRVKTGRRALLTVLAVLRYEKEKGRYPVGLEELVEAGYLKELPMDPYSDGPMIYKRTDGGFLLYSFGMNLTDDEGKLGLSSRGTPRMWMDNGDWVFWPVVKPQTKK